MQLSIKNGLNRYGDSLMEIKRVNIPLKEDIKGYKYRIAKGREMPGKKLGRFLKLMGFAGKGTGDEY